MHIVCLAHSYPRFEGDVAGTFVEQLNLGLRARGHDVKVIAPSERGAGTRERTAGISVSRVRYAPARLETLAYHGDMQERARSPFGRLAAASLMVAQASEIGHLNQVSRVDVVHAHWWVPGGVSAWLARLVRKPRYVVTLHGSDVRLLDRSASARWLARRVLRGAAAVTAVSSYLADRAARIAGIAPDRILVQPMPVPVDRFDRQSLGGGGIVTIGRLTEQKNVDDVLEAVARLRQQGVDTHLHIIGDGPRRQALEYRARGLGVEDIVWFKGAVAPDEIPATVGDADVMVFPAIAEGLGLVAAEALLMGVPVVATQAGGGVTDIVPPTGAGRLVPPHDPAALAHAIRELLETPGSLYLAEQAGDSLRKRIAPDVVAKVFEKVYEQVVGQGGRPEREDA